MKLNYKIKIKLILMSVLLTSCFTANKFSNKESRSGKPLWVLKMKSPKFPDSKYIQGVGFSKEEGDEKIVYQKNADSSAINAIAQQIRVDIKGRSVDIQRETTTDNETTSTSYIELVTKLTVSLKELEGVTISDRYIDEESKMYFSLAVLNRSKASYALNSIIVESKQRAFEYFKGAEDLVNINSVSKAFKSYLLAANELKIAFEKERLLRAISGRSSKKVIDEISLPQVESKILDMVTKLKITKVSGDNQEGSISEALPDPLVIKVTYENKGLGLPFDSFPVKFYFKEGVGTLSKDSYTNDEGVARTFVSKVLPSGVARNVIDVRLDYSGFLEDNVNIMPVKNEFVYSLITKNDIKILLSINERYDGVLRSGSIIEGVLLKELKASDFNVIDKKSISAINGGFDNLSPSQIKKKMSTLCDVLIFGTIDTAKKSEVSGLIFAESIGTIKVIYVKKANIIAAVNIVPMQVSGDGGYDTKGAGLNIKKAVLNSLINTAKAVSKDTVEKIEKAFDSGFKGD